MPGFLDDPYLTLALAVGLTVMASALVRRRTARKRGRRRKLRGEAALLLPLYKVLTDALKRVEGGEALSEDELQAVEKAAGQLGMAGNERERDLAGKGAALVLTYAAGLKGSSADPSPEAGRQREELVRSSRELAGRIRRKLVVSGAERIRADRN